MKKLQKRTESRINTVEANATICICGCASSATSVSYSKTVYAY